MFLICIKTKCFQENACNLFTIHYCQVFRTYLWLFAFIFRLSQSWLTFESEWIFSWLKRIKKTVWVQTIGQDRLSLPSLLSFEWSAWKKDTDSIIYKKNIFYVNYTLYKNAGFWLVNSRDIFFYKFRPCIVNLQNFYFI